MRHEPFRGSTPIAQYHVSTVIVESVVRKHRQPSTYLGTTAQGDLTAHKNPASNDATLHIQRGEYSVDIGSPPPSPDHP